MSKCANNKLSGCLGLVTQKGNIYCDGCLEEKKAQTKNRREHELDHLLTKNYELENELKKKTIDQQLLSRLQQDNVALVKANSILETTISQLKIDNEKLKLDNDRLRSIGRVSDIKPR